MLVTQLCLVLLVFTHCARCQHSTGNSSGEAAHAQVASLRRQLMRDNYDYALDDDEPKHMNVSAKEDDSTKIYYKKDGTDHAPETAELTQTDGTAEHGQYEESGPREQVGQYEHRVRYEPSQYGFHGQREQFGQEELSNQYASPKNTDPALDQKAQVGPQGQQGGNPSEFLEPSYADAGQLTVQSTPDSDLARRHLQPHIARQIPYNPSYHNKQRETYAPSQAAPQQAKPFSDLRGDFIEQYGENDAVGPSDQVEQAENDEYNPEEQEAIDQQNMSDSQYDESDYTESQKQSREIYNEFGHTTRARVQHYTRPSATNASPHRGHHSLSYQKSRNYYEVPSRNHQYHAPPAHRYRTSSSRAYDTVSGSTHHSLPEYNHHAPSGRHHHVPSEDRYAPLDHNISKKDLLYYMDDTQLRRHNNEMSPYVADEEELAYSQPRGSPNSPRGSPNSPWGSPNSPRGGPSSPRVSPTSSPAPPVTPKPFLNLPNTEHARRSFVVTVSPNNVTYKLLTLKTRDGRRRGQRRILEERGPGGVAIISLDHAPLPAFRLPRARRQYMHQHHHRRKPST